jgi:glucose/arabinose dehydrogenase
VLALAFAVPRAGAQTVADPRLEVETVTTGLSVPTTLDFLGPDDILVLEKNTGNVRRVLNGTLLASPVLSVSVNTSSERGLLGIAINSEQPPGVFLYYTEAGVILNRVYRYDWNAQLGVLENPSLILDLPGTPGPNHDGGVLVLGPPGEIPGFGDGAALFAVIGDLNRNNQLENFPAGGGPDDTAVILRVRQDGAAAPGNPFSTAGFERYFAYGIRNSFGLALDPVTGDLWDTENGPSTMDEVNRVAPGFNSGWEQIMGPDARDPQGEGDLFQVTGSAYSDPEFSWLDTVAPTAIVFPVGSLLGPSHDDVALVGDSNNGLIYRFPLNTGRTGFELRAIQGLGDLVADTTAERDSVVWGTGFGRITDLEIGPLGHLYVVSLRDGAIYRVSGGPLPIPSLAPWGVAGVVLALLAGAWASITQGAAARSSTRRWTG